ncbi:hypothetical protein [Bosea sp. OAE506]|uniref:hypothetical protein n=1 Tax=Bosea sp. OAE506 TaxID=2663870 RepID=UPI0033934BE7
MLPFGPDAPIEMEEVRLALLVSEGDKHLELFHRSGTPTKGSGKALAVWRGYGSAEREQPLYGAGEASEQTSASPRTAINWSKVDDRPVLSGRERFCGPFELRSEGSVVWMVAVENGDEAGT